MGKKHATLCLELFLSAEFTALGGSGVLSDGASFRIGTLPAPRIQFCSSLVVQPCLILLDTSIPQLAGQAWVAPFWVSAQIGNESLHDGTRPGAGILCEDSRITHLLVVTRAKEEGLPKVDFVESRPSVVQIQTGDGNGFA